jgi:hypothetical protein
MRVTSALLDDTLKIFQLARETAKLQGQPNQAERLTPLVKNLTNLISEAREPQSTIPPQAVSNLMTQTDFKTLLAAIQPGEQSPSHPQRSQIASSPTEKSHIVIAMSNSGMPALDIARQMGMPLEEVQMMLTINRVTR